MMTKETNNKRRKKSTRALLSVMLSLLIFLQGFIGSAPVYADSVEAPGLLYKSSLSIADTGTSNTASYQVGDFDNDGDIDILTQDDGAGKEVAFWKNDGSGSFTNDGKGHLVPSTGLNLSFNLTRVADFDNDGDLDIYCRVSGSSNDLYYSNDGSGYFTAAALPIEDTGTSSTACYQVGDFDNDGDIDILTQDKIGDDVTFWENDGTGSFTKNNTKGIPGTTGLNMAIIATKVADFDNDGDLDIYCRVSGPSNDLYYRNDGSGYFTAAALPIADTGTNNIACYQVGDFDNDGDIDILTQDDGNGNYVTFWESDGTGSFKKNNTEGITGTADLNLSVTATRVADFDNDGDLDIYSRVLSSSSRFYYQNSNIPPRVTSITPASNATNVGVSDSITLTLINSSPISKGTGTIFIKVDDGDGNYANDTVFESFPVTDTRVSLSGDSSSSTVTIDPSGTFAANTTYYLVIPPSAFLDAQGKGFVTLVGNRFHPGIPNPAIRQAGNSLHRLIDRTLLSFSTEALSAPSTDATLKVDSTVKGQVVTSLGTPNATLGSETAGSVTLTAEQAADTSNAGDFITLFDRNNSNASSVKVVKYESGVSTANFETDTAYDNKAISNGDFFIVKVVAEDGTTTQYYRVNAIVTPGSGTGVSVAPTLTGTTTMSLTEGYSATSTGVFTITGTEPVTVTKTSGDGGITWNDGTKKLDIAAGLAAGSYPVELKASNGTTPDATLTFTLTVNAAQSTAPDAVHLNHENTTTDYVTIQEAINAAVDGDLITIEAGTFREQLTITKNITLQGAGIDQTIIEAPNAADLTQSGSDWKNLKNQDVYAVVGIKTTTQGTVTIRNLTVDGRDQGFQKDARYPDDKNKYAFQGIGVYNSTACIDTVKVTRVRELETDYDPAAVIPEGYPADQPAGMNHNEGIFAESAAGQAEHTLTVTHSVVTKFQKTAILAWGPTLVVDINNTTIQGYGKTLKSTGNGIQIGSSDRSGLGESNGNRTGTKGSITNNEILNLGIVVPEPGEPGSYLNLGLGGSTGILLWEAGDGVLIQGNTITRTDITRSWHSSNTSADGGWSNTAIILTSSKNVQIEDNIISGFDSGVALEKYTTVPSMTARGNVVSDTTHDYWSNAGDNEIILGNQAEAVAYYAEDNGIDSISNFGIGDAIYVMDIDSPGTVNGLREGDLTVNFTGGTVTEGDGTDVAAHSVELSVTDNITTLSIDTNGEAGAPELTLKLKGRYKTGNFVLDGAYIKFQAMTPEVTALAVKTPPAKLTYTAGEVLDLSSLVVTLTYSDDLTEDIPLTQFGAKGITASPANGTALVVATHHGQPVTLTCNGHMTTLGTLTVNAPIDATLKANSTVKGQTVTDLGTPNAALASVVAGSVILSTEQAGDTSNAGSYVTLFGKNDSNATVKVVKYASGTSPDEAAFTSALPYANEAISNGDFFIIKVEAQDEITTLYYKVNTTVTPVFVAPGITGPTVMSLTEGYSVTSTDVYTITGTAPVTVTKTSGDGGITWNDETKKLDIAAGLVAGSYPVALKASNGTAPDATLTFTLTITDDEIAPPNVTANDLTNQITGADNTMEYSTNGGTTWTAYDSANPPTFTGNQTVQVRTKASGSNPAGPATTLTFTVNLSEDAAITAKATSYNISGNTIQSNTAVIHTDVTVESFLSNLNKHENAAWKIIPEGTPMASPADFANATAKAAAVKLAKGDKLAVLAEDGVTLKVYAIALSESNNAGIATLAETAITTGNQAGTKEAPKTASVNVAHAKSSIGLTDIGAAANATVKLYSDAGFTQEITGSTTLALTPGGATTVYIKVTAQDETTIKYYAITLHRAESSHNDHGSSSSTPSPAQPSTPANSTVIPVNVTGNPTGPTTQTIKAQITSDSNGTQTLSFKSQEAILEKKPDGTRTEFGNPDKLSLTPSEGTTSSISLSADGTIQVKKLANGTESQFNVTFDLGNGQKIAIGRIEVKVDKDGAISLTSTLIDPYGIILDSSTNHPISGVDVKLYYADTARNRANGKTPDTLVALPALAGFEPNDNANPQVSDSYGAYAYMVFPESDYYLSATKEGYERYKSSVISVEQDIVKWDFKMNKSLIGLQRLFGLDRVETAIAIAKANYPGKVVNVVLATADNYPDALTGSVLAYKLNAPLVLVGSTAKEQELLLAYMKDRVETDGTIYILGGTGAVSAAAEQTIKANGYNSIIRLGGISRYDTAVKIAEELDVEQGRPVILAYGENYPDALSVSTAAAVTQSPILLVEKNGVSDAVKNKLAQIKPIKVYIIGLEGVISQQVEAEVAQVTSLKKENIIRIGGIDRYQTSLEVAKYFNLSGQNIGIATGNNFPDALAGSVYAANYNAPILLLNDSIPNEVMEYLKTREMTGVTIFGGEAVINSELEQRLRELID